jgi:hypothetical protein
MALPSSLDFVRRIPPEGESISSLRGSSKRARQVGFYLVLAGLAIALLSPARSSVASKTLHFSVNVQDAETGAPIVHATITLGNRLTDDIAQPMSTKTGADGTATLGLPCEVSEYRAFGIVYRSSVMMIGYYVSVSHSGFATRNIQLQDIVGSTPKPAAIEQLTVRFKLSPVR